MVLYDNTTIRKSILNEEGSGRKCAVDFQLRMIMQKKKYQVLSCLFVCLWNHRLGSPHARTSPHSESFRLKHTRDSPTRKKKCALDISWPPVVIDETFSVNRITAGWIWRKSDFLCCVFDIIHVRCRYVFEYNICLFMNVIELQQHNGSWMCVCVMALCTVWS